MFAHHSSASTRRTPSPPEDWPGGALETGIERALLVGARLGNEPSPDGQRPISAAMNPCMQVLEGALHPRLVVLPCHAINPGGGTALERQECVPQ